MRTARYAAPPGRSIRQVADEAASPAQQLKWANNYATAETKVKFVGSVPVIPRADDGSVPAMMAAELTLARSGALDTDLAAPSGA
jgi:hypothetical protein